MLLNEGYFEDKTLMEMSAAGIMYMQLVKPEMMFEVYRQGQAQGFGIEAFLPEVVPQDQWLNCLRKASYANDIVLRSAILKHEEIFTEEIFQRFITTGNDVFIDHALFILALSNMDLELRLIEALPKFRYPYSQSVACLLLGARGSLACAGVLDHYYHWFNTQYPEEKFAQAPLFGLRLLLDRQRHVHHHDHDHHEHGPNCVCSTSKP